MDNDTNRRGVLLLDDQQAQLILHALFDAYGEAKVSADAELYPLSELLVAALDEARGETPERLHTLRVSDEELRLLWLGTETLREANEGGEAEELAKGLDDKVTALVHGAGLVP